MSEETTIRCEQVIPTLGVGDVASALAYYADVFGFEEAWRWGDPPRHAGLKLDAVEVHLSATEPNPGGGFLYFVIADVDTLYATYRERGVDIGHEPRDQEWGMRELLVRDMVGNELVFASPCITREPKLPIAREQMKVRLETRIVAVLRDLAEHKSMDVGELLEETLLHTFEAMPEGGVASPHTKSDLRRIQELKELHGIDYDTHASYRFVEEEDGAG